MWTRPVSEVTFRTRRRAASVPAPEEPVIRTSRYGAGGRANVIASHANEDTDFIAAASKRNDREFLNEVSAKMANLTTGAILLPRSSCSRDTSPSVHRRPLPPLAPASNYLRRAATLTPEDNYDIEAYLQHTPRSSRSTASAVNGYGSVAGRSLSVPPVGVSHTLPYSVRPSVPRWYPMSATRYGPAATSGSPSAVIRSGGLSPLPTGLPPRIPSGDRRDAITDSVVGVAHTSHYGDIVIGIPCKKRFMYNVQRELDDLDTQSLPATHVSRYSNGPYFANTRPASIAIPHGTPELNRPYSRASYAGSLAGGVGYGYRPLANHTPRTASSLAADLDDVISIKSCPGAFVGGRYPARTSYRPLASRNSYKTVGEFENDVDMLDFDDSGATSQLSALKRDAKSVLNRYSMAPPTSTTSNGPRHLTSSELDQKYGKILTDMQTHNRIPPTKKDYSTPPLPPYPAPPRKPAMSDTRRKLRDLLCRSRNDPHYFED